MGAVNSPHLVTRVRPSGNSAQRALEPRFPQHPEPQLSLDHIVSRTWPIFLLAEPIATRRKRAPGELESGVNESRQSEPSARSLRALLALISDLGRRVRPNWSRLVGSIGYIHLYKVRFGTIDPGLSHYQINVVFASVRSRHRVELSTFVRRARNHRIQQSQPR